MFFQISLFIFRRLKFNDYKNLICWNNRYHKKNNNFSVKVIRNQKLSIENVKLFRLKLKDDENLTSQNKIKPHKNTTFWLKIIPKSQNLIYNANLYKLM